VLFYQLYIHKPLGVVQMLSSNCLLYNGLHGIQHPSVRVSAICLERFLNELTCLDRLEGSFTVFKYVKT
jgi:hypothetical protein